MNYDEDNYSCSIHTNAEIDYDSDDASRDFDEPYEKNKPAPVLLHKSGYLIINVRQCERISNRKIRRFLYRNRNSSIQHTGQLTRKEVPCLKNSQADKTTFQKSSLNHKFENLTNIETSKCETQIRNTFKNKSLVFEQDTDDNLKNEKNFKCLSNDTPVLVQHRVSENKNKNRKTQIQRSKIISNNPKCNFKKKSIKHSQYRVDKSKSKEVTVISVLKLLKDAITGSLKSVDKTIIKCKVLVQHQLSENKNENRKTQIKRSKIISKNPKRNFKKKSTKHSQYRVDKSKSKEVTVSVLKLLTNTITGLLKSVDKTIIKCKVANIINCSELFLPFIKDYVKQLLNEAQCSVNKENLKLTITTFIHLCADVLALLKCIIVSDKTQSNRNKLRYPCYNNNAVYGYRKVNAVRYEPDNVYSYIATAWYSECKYVILIIIFYIFLIMFIIF